MPSSARKIFPRKSAVTCPAGRRNQSCGSARKGAAAARVPAAAIRARGLGDSRRGGHHRPPVCGDCNQQVCAVKPAADDHITRRVVCRVALQCACLRSLSALAHIETQRRRHRRYQRQPSPPNCKHMRIPHVFNRQPCRRCCNRPRHQPCGA